jgi:adenylate kinase family enzyme
LLVGPTGSGKTPLGDLLAELGLWRQRCVHFDFGARLRAVVRRGCPDDLITRADIEFLKQVLDSAALLEDEQFPLAEKVLRSFLAGEQTSAQTVVVLNGLPRHAGQARAVDGILDVEALIELRCSAETVFQRIRANIGGDRTDRLDDDIAAVRRKLDTYAARTAPLVDYYRDLGKRVETIDVTPGLHPDAVWRILQSR